jgi:GNAT superfamily N-acetyltransferase
MPEPSIGSGRVTDNGLGTRGVPVRLSARSHRRRSCRGHRRLAPAGAFSVDTLPQAAGNARIRADHDHCPSVVSDLHGYGAKVEAAHNDEPHWYLVVLSVRPDSQRRGLGSRLVEPILERADRQGLPCRLETSDPANVFYQRFGFEVTDPAFAAIPGGPHLTTMQRPSPTPRQ